MNATTQAAAVMQIGEGFAGSSTAAAHVNTLYGPRTGPVGHAFAAALASPTQGHTPFLCVLQPGLAVVPPTLFVNKATCDADTHSRATWGPAQAGVAEGVRDALVAGTLANPESSCVVAAVWVDPNVDESDFAAVFTHNRVATREALARGAASLPLAQEALESGPAWNPFYDPRNSGRPPRP